MRFFRSERVSSLIREELGQMLVREIEVPDTLITITEVEIDKKLDHAKVKVSIIPASAVAEALATLEKKAGYLQHLLLKKINIKPMPRISFALDRGPENAADVEKVLLKK
jgi:ribosome-binding factor A